MCLSIKSNKLKLLLVCEGEGETGMGVLLGGGAFSGEV